jgi:predicted dehydrogenase
MSLQRPKVDAEEPLRAELKAFLHAVENRSRPIVTLEDGRRALALALDIVRSMAEHHHRANLEKVAFPKG